MSDPVYQPRLPTTAIDGQQVLTSSGNIFEFNAEKNEWVCIGVAPPDNTVSVESDGLVPPELYRKLVLIQELIDQGFDFNHFKLDTDVQDPYYYFLHSSDDLVKFTPEKVLTPKETKFSSVVTGIAINADGTSTVELEDRHSQDFSGLVLQTAYASYEISSSRVNELVINTDQVNILVGDSVKVVKLEEMVTRLRIEVNKQRLYRKLVRNCCIGPKGLKGDQGDQGTAGTAAANEIFQPLKIEPSARTVSWETTVETPIDTPISLRIFGEDDDTVLLELLHSIDGSAPVIIISDEDLSIEETSFDSNYDPTSKKFSGYLVISEGGDDIESWRFKARQQGKKGAKGKDGSPFLEVITNLLEDPSIRSTNAIVSSRRGTVNGDIVIFKSDLFEEIPVSNLSAVGGVGINILEDQFTAVNVTVEEARDIGFYQFSPPDYTPPPLDIPLWTPTSDCVQSRRWVQYRYDWFTKTEPDYLFSIMMNPKPPEQCCQEDFFFCPNVGDGPCPVQGEIDPPVPQPVPCICECVSPIQNDLDAGIFTFPPMDLTSSEAAISDAGVVDEVLSAYGAEDAQVAGSGSGSAGSGASSITSENATAILVNSAESVINGGDNEYTQDITIQGLGEVIVIVDYESDACGGKVVEYDNCAFIDSSSVSSMFSITNPGGTGVITSGNVQETTSIPSTVAFTIVGESSTTVSESVGDGGETIITEETTYTPTNFSLNINVNTGAVDYCRAYRVIVIVITRIPPPETTEIRGTGGTAGIPGSGGSGPESTIVVSGPTDGIEISSGGGIGGGIDCSLIASPTSVQIPNTSTVTMTLTSGGFAVSGHAVAFSSPNTGVTITPASGNTDGTGALSATVSSSNIGNVTVRASYLDNGNTEYCEVIIGFTAAAGSGGIPGSEPVGSEPAGGPYDCAIIASPDTNIPDDGAHYTTITVTITSGGSPVVGESVTVNSTGSGNSFSPSATGTTNASGQFVTSMASTVAESKTLSVSAVSGLTGACTDIVTFTSGTPGVPYDANCTVITSGGIDNDGVDSCTITVTLLDFYGDPVSGEGVAVYGDFGDTLVPTNGSTNGSGIFTSTLTTTREGVSSTTISAFNELVGYLSDTAVVSVVDIYVPYEPNCYITVFPSTISTAYSTRIVIAVRGIRDTPLSSETMTLDVSGTGNTFFPSGSGGISGTYGYEVKDLTSSVEEAKTVGVDIDNDGVAGNITSTGAVTFSGSAIDTGAGNPSRGSSIGLISGGTGTRDADGVDSFSITWTVRDEFYNPVTGYSVTPGATGSGWSFSPPSGTTNGSGQFTTSMTSTEVDGKIVYLDVGGGKYIRCTTIARFAPV